MVVKVAVGGSSDRSGWWGELVQTLPEPHAAVVARGGEQRAGDVPGDAPHARVVLLEGGHHLGAEAHAAAPVRRRRRRARRLPGNANKSIKNTV